MQPKEADAACRGAVAANQEICELGDLSTLPMGVNVAMRRVWIPDALQRGVKIGNASFAAARENRGCRGSRRRPLSAC